MSNRHHCREVGVLAESGLDPQAKTGQWRSELMSRQLHELIPSLLRASAADSSAT